MKKERESASKTPLGLRLSPGVPPHPKALAQAKMRKNPALDSLRLRLLVFLGPIACVEV